MPNCASNPGPAAKCNTADLDSVPQVPPSRSEARWVKCPVSDEAGLIRFFTFPQPKRKARKPLRACPPLANGSDQCAPSKSSSDASKRLLLLLAC
jgi:hypothetical protein